MLLSLFCGAGGLDKGFEDAGYDVGLAYDRRAPAVRSYNANRTRDNVGRVGDVNALSLETLDADYGSTFKPTGLIGGPPCQSFSRANAGRSLDDPRAKLVGTFVALALELHARSPLDFVVMENVPELLHANEGGFLSEQVKLLEAAGFVVETQILNAADYGVAQNRRRMFMVALNSEQFERGWERPEPTSQSPLTVAAAIKHLPEPTFYSREATVSTNTFHANHWCMTPKSPRFFDGTLQPGYSAGRSFKTLHWERPSLSVSYGNREVHVHPTGKRRLSVFEAMLLQGFGTEYVLLGTLSDQISQVSEAVPPPLAKAVASSIVSQTPST